MRVFILALGTRGDFELFRGLGEALHARGHAVTIGSSPFNAGGVAEAGLHFVPIGEGERDELVAVLRALAAEPDLAQRTRSFAERWLRPQLAAGSRTLAAAGARSDYFVSNLKLALQRGASVVPGAFVTYDPPAAISDLPRYASARHGGRVIELVAMNKALADPDDRWGAPFRFTGFWRPLLHRATQPETLDRFLSSGPAPVVLTMGSMATFDAERMLDVFGEALDRSGQRGVVVGGWGGLGAAAAENARLCRVEEADYGELFARAACVVHHGGAGTVSAALHAGRPSIVLPQLVAQQRFAEMLVRERLATGAFDADTADAATLATAIGRALEDPSVADSALRWQRRVAADDGVAGAAAAIEAHAARHPQVIGREA